MEEKEILKAFGSVYDYLNDKTIYDLRTLAREFGVNAPSAARKHDLILRIIIAAAALAEPEKVSRRLFVPNYPPGRDTSESLNVAVATAVVCAEFRRRMS